MVKPGSIDTLGQMLFSCQEKTGNLWPPNPLSALPYPQPLPKAVRGFSRLELCFPHQHLQPSRALTGQKGRPSHPCDGGPWLKCLTLIPALWVLCLAMQDADNLAARDLPWEQETGSSWLQIEPRAQRYTALIAFIPFSLLFFFPTHALSSRLSQLSPFPNLHSLQLNFFWDAHQELLYKPACGIILSSLWVSCITRELFWGKEQFLFHLYQPELISVGMKQIPRGR